MTPPVLHSGGLEDLSTDTPADSFSINLSAEHPGTADAVHVAAVHEPAKHFASVHACPNLLNLHDSLL
jgi:hypothetical protein